MLKDYHYHEETRVTGESGVDKPTDNGESGVVGGLSAELSANIQRNNHTLPHQNAKPN